MTTAQFMNAYSTLSAPVKAKVLFGLMLNEQLNGGSAPEPTILPKRDDLPASPDKLVLPEGTDVKKVEKLRRKIVNQIWEIELRKELVDRLVFAVVTKMTDYISLEAAIKRAKSLKSDYERTDGRYGKDVIWKPLSSWCKDVYESNGVAWKKVASGPEPRPIRRLPEIVIEGAEDEPDYEDEDSRERAREEYQITRDRICKAAGK